MRHLASIAFLAGLGSVGSIAPAQDALLRRAGDLHPVPTTRGSLASVVDRLLRGPTAAEQRASITTAIPSGTERRGLQRLGDTVTLTLSHHLFKSKHFEDAIEQIDKTILRAAACKAVRIRVRDAAGVTRDLADVLRDQTPPPAPIRRTPPLAFATTGALSGKTIVMSPGHGFYWHTTLGWTTQRPLIDGLIEDIHNGEIANRYIIPALENMGARVISCREHGEIVLESTADNDAGPSFFKSTGPWGTFSSGGYRNTGYRSAWTSGTTSATATWTPAVTVDGIYPVYVFARAIANASTDARFTVHHSGGATSVRVNQRTNDRRWTRIGSFSFTRQGGARIVLDNQSANTNTIVVADAVRIGGGVGSIPRGAGTSGKPRWQECSRYWTEFVGAPSSVWNTASGQDNNDDVTARPRYAEWRGADCYISLHTNAGGGGGTSSYIHSTSPTAGSARLQSVAHAQIVSDIRRLYDSSWTDRGRLSANFGEVRLLSSMPGMLLELAFHDTANSKDHRALHDPRFRFIAGRAYARGVMRYFSNAAFPPEKPAALRVTQASNRGLRVAWEPVAGASFYAIEQSPDGKGFVEVAQTAATNWTTGPLPHGTALSFRVRAGNTSGVSFPTEVLTAGTSHTKRAALLMVQGFDRLGRYVKGPENTGDYLRLHAAAIRAAQQFSLGFDAASNEAVLLGRVPLANYAVVDWASGEESTADQTFSSTEQNLVRSYLNGGGRLLVTGAEIGWDLVARGSAADRTFYETVIGARYVADDANTYGFRAAAGTHIFSGIPAGAFDDGRSGTYDVNYADVIAPFDAKSTLCLTYSDGRGAGIQRIDGNSRVVHLGFPLETITDAGLRAEVMVRALRFLLAPRSLEALPTIAVGNTRDLDLFLPADAGAPFVLAASLQLGAISLPVDHVVPLTPDIVMDISLQANNGVFVGFQGTLDNTGRGRARFVVPSFPGAKGLTLFFSGATLTTTSAIRTMLPWVRIRTL